MLKKQTDCLKPWGLLENKDSLSRRRSSHRRLDNPIVSLMHTTRSVIADDFSLEAHNCVLLHIMIPPNAAYIQQPWFQLKSLLSFPTSNFITCHIRLSQRLTPTLRNLAEAVFRCSFLLAIALYQIVPPPMPPRRSSSLQVYHSNLRLPSSSSLSTATSEETMPYVLTSKTISGTATSSSTSPVELDSTGAHTFGQAPTPPWLPQNGSPSDDTNNNDNGTIVVGIVSVLVLIFIIIVIYKRTTFHKKSTHGEDEEELRAAPGCSPARPERDDDDDDDDEAKTIGMQDLEAQESSYEAGVVVCTARQARLYGPGSASMVDIRGRGVGEGRGDTTGSSDSISSSRSVVDVESLPDLYGAQALLIQGGGRATRDHLSLMEALNDESMASSVKVTTMSCTKDESAEPMQKSEGKRRRKVLRKRMTSKQFLGDMLKAYAA